jgi:CHAT domain-containing protein
MKMARRLSCRLLFLLCTLPLTPVSAQDDDFLQRLPTLESRKYALADLINQQTGLAETGAYPTLVRLLNRTGELQLRLFDLDAALASANESLAIATRFRGTQDEALYVDSLILCARVHVRRDENKLAIPLLTQALELSEKLHYRAEEAASHSQFGLAYIAQYEYEKAEASNDKALTIWRELNNKPAEAQTLVNQGETYMLREKQQESADTLKQAVAVSRELNDHARTANALFDLSFLAMKQGQWESARGFLNEAETYVTDKDAEPFLAGQIAMSYGLIYEAYGQLETARNYLQDSLTYYRDRAHDKGAGVDAGRQLARVQARLKNYTQARAQVEQDIEIAKQTEKNLFIGLCYEDLGFVLLASETPEEAKLAFQSALSYFKPDTRPWARTQSYLGQTEYLLGNTVLAGEAYNKALQFFQSPKGLDYTNEASLRFGLGKLALRQGDFAEAETQLERSINLTKVLRENASSRDLRSSFLDSVHNRYEAYVEVLMASYFQKPDHALQIQAFEASESGRALALLDSLNDNRQELRQPSNPALLQEEMELQKQEQQLIDRQTEAISRNATKSELDKVNKELDDVRSRYETLQARLNASTKFANLLRPTISYEEIKRQLTDSNTSLLEYSLGETNSFAWLITRDGIQSFRLAGKETIENAVNTLVRLLQDPLIDPDKEKQLESAINDVSRLVLEPVSTQLQTSRLIVIADGALQNVPFQVLKAFPNASEPLVAQFDIVEAPSASALASVRQERMRRDSGSRMLIAFGDAIFSPDYGPSSSVNNQGSSVRADEGRTARILPRLFQAKRELRNIADLAGAESSLYMGFNATRDNLLNADLSQYRILHVVTHGTLNDSEPELSGLYLSLVDANGQPLDGFVGLADIYRMRAPMDLVVLSACQTAMGKELRGEGLISLTRGFMYAGAASVVASLWQVNDAASAELMKYFYTYLLQDGMTPPAALRAAQNKIRSNPKWSSPYYWAGFTIQGDYDLNFKTSSQVTTKVEKVVVGVASSMLVLALAYWYLRRRQYHIN